jgi:ABC-type transport system involved in cytochrome bd biosynthesis fused ATPase/permease subunit
MANLARRAGSATIIIAAHHAREAACADRVVRLDAPKQAPALQLAPSDAHFRVESKILLRHDGDASA